jgi:hypothetical protein
VKLVGFLLLVSGGIIALMAIAMLPPTAARGAFILAGLAIEIVGLVLVFRSHMPVKEERG